MKISFVYITLIAIRELSYAAPPKSVKLCGDERKPHPPLSLKRTVCISLPCSICEPCSKCRTPSLWHKKKQRKKSTALLLKKGGFVSVNLIGMWELSYAVPSSLGKLCSDERKNLRINHSSCTEKQPMRNRATRQLIALWLFEAW